MRTATFDETVVIIIITRAINVSKMTKSLLRHDTKQSEEAVLGRGEFSDDCGMGTETQFTSQNY